MNELLYSTDCPMAHIPSRTYMLHIPSFWAPPSSALKYWEPRPWDGVLHPGRKNHCERLRCPCRLNTESFGIILFKWTAFTFTTTSDFRARFRKVYPRRRTSVDVVYRQLTDKLCFITVPNTCYTCTFALASTHTAVKTILEMDISGGL